MSRERCRWIELALLLALAGCHSETNPPHVYPEAGVGHDGFQFPDRGPYPDWWSPPRDLLPARDSAGADAGGDGGSCVGPSGASCAVACAGEEICTAAKGGTCAGRLELSGPATSKPVLVAVTEALVACWAKWKFGKHALCGAFAACGMSGDLTRQTLDDFVCKQAQISDFSSPAVYNGSDGARSIFNCDGRIFPFGIYRFDWWIDEIPAGKEGVVCFAFHKYTTGVQDKVDLIACEKATL